MSGEGRKGRRNRPRNHPPHEPDPLTGEMMEALLFYPFPRGSDLEIYTDEQGFVRASVPYHAVHYVPDSLGPINNEQYRAGPGSEGHPGLYELGLSVMAYYLPSGFEDEEPVILRTKMPRSDPMPVSRSAWELHRDYAEEVLLHIDPEYTTLPVLEIYDWVARKRPQIADLVLGPPGEDPFLDGLF